MGRRNRHITNFEEVCRKIRIHSIADIAPLVGADTAFSGRASQKGDIYIICPFHRETTPSLKYSTQNDLFYCYGCQRSGNLIDFYAKISGGSFLNSVILLAHFFKINVRWTKTAKSR